jgi:quercetin dioxygenase-like cupin family protein
MADYSITANGDTGPLPPDNLSRSLTVSSPDDPNLVHLSVVGDSYTVLVSGKQTEGRYCLIDMLVPDGSGPPSHRHSFEEMFTLLEGELEFTFRGQTMMVAQGATVNIPANAPHQFRNASGKTVHMLCMRTPAGQEEFFAQVGDRVSSRTSPPPQLSKEEQAERGKRSAELAPKYRTEML